MAAEVIPHASAADLRRLRSDARLAAHMYGHLGVSQDSLACMSCLSRAAVAQGATWRLAPGPRPSTLISQGLRRHCWQGRWPHAPGHTQPAAWQRAQHAQDHRAGRDGAGGAPSACRWIQGVQARAVEQTVASACPRLRAAASQSLSSLAGLAGLAVVGSCQPAGMAPRTSGDGALGSDGCATPCRPNSASHQWPAARWRPTPPLSWKLRSRRLRLHEAKNGEA